MFHADFRLFVVVPLGRPELKILHFGQILYALRNYLLLMYIFAHLNLHRVRHGSQPRQR